ncbi:MAG: HEPN domain-containing protein [Sulfuricellaceae bacterium]
MTPADYTVKANRALVSARLLLESGDFEGACNRAYYAMFDAAHAALLQSGAHVNPAETKTHSGLIGAFGKHLVKPGLVSAELGRSLNQVEHVRLLADYTGEDIGVEKAAWAVDQAQSFLNALC